MSLFIVILFTFQTLTISASILWHGFKPSQRKVLFGCLKRKLTVEIRVASLAGYISEHCAYHHGEASLQKTIIKMAQNFVGANNIELLNQLDSLVVVFLVVRIVLKRAYSYAPIKECR